LHALQVLLDGCSRLHFLTVQNLFLRLPENMGQLASLDYLSLSHRWALDLPDSITQLTRLRVRRQAYCSLLIAVCKTRHGLAAEHCRDHNWLHRNLGGAGKATAGIADAPPRDAAAHAAAAGMAHTCGSQPSWRRWVRCQRCKS
jgi:hypothetical protein